MDDHEEAKERAAISLVHPKSRAGLNSTANLKDNCYL
jgi:hypothetical protein